MSVCSEISSSSRLSVPPDSSYASKESDESDDNFHSPMSRTSGISNFYVTARFERESSSCSIDSKLEVQTSDLVFFESIDTYEFLTLALNSIIYGSSDLADDDGTSAYA